VKEELVDIVHRAGSPWSTWPGSASPPRSLYRYLNFENAKQALRDRQIYFCSPRDFNDPFDCRLHPAFEGSYRGTNSVAKLLANERFAGQPRNFRRGKARELAIKLHQGFLERVFREWRCEYVDNSGMICLSESCGDILMWSHYAEKHTGVVLEFDLLSLA
jgi:hypothetical protein